MEGNCPNWRTQPPSRGEQAYTIFESDNDDDHVGDDDEDDGFSE